MPCRRDVHDMTEQDRVGVTLYEFGDGACEDRRTLDSRRKACEGLDTDSVEPVGQGRVELPSERSGHLAKLFGEHADREDTIESHR